MTEGGGAGSVLRLDTVTNRDRTVILVRGDVDAVTAPQLGAVVETVLTDAHVVELDLSELGFLDSTGLSVIASILQKLTPVDGRLELRSVPPMVVRLLEITDMARFVTILSERD